MEITVGTQVNFVTDGPIGRVQLHTENGVQLLGADTREQLRQTLTEIARHDDLSVVVFESTGRTFIAGADINELRALNPETAYENSREGQAVMGQIAALPFTTIAAIHAACAGGGTELALACDMRLAASSAVIGLPETRIGVIPGWGGTVRATRLLGSAVARRMILTGELLPAATALQLGLIDELVPDDEFRDAVERRIAMVLGRGPHARDTASKLLAAFEGPDPETQFEAEARAFAACYQTNEPETGMAAFLDKQPADWQLPPGP
jgi:enoyl-CoA hydratase/carnithine racemase